MLKKNWKVGLIAIFCMFFGEEFCGYKKNRIKSNVTITQIIDGDTLVVNGEKIGLKGIDAPEMRQKCSTSDICGAKAAAKLEELIGNNGVFCSKEGLDRYGRQLGYCYAGGLNLNSEMVRSGHAKAYSKFEKTFEAEEREAKKRKLGMWSDDKS